MKTKPKASGSIVKQSITAFGFKAMKIYADEVNLDRATPDLIDGLKPVYRRLLWSASQMPGSAYMKSARITGDTMGKYHPHGDSSLYGAMVTMVQACTPLFHGEGNWGNLVDGAAAARYTNARLSFFGRTGFDPNYAHREVTSFVPNYDDKDVEPVSIPYPLPVILFNGGEGIGYGAACNIPAFTPDSVVDVLKRLLSGEKLNPEDFAKALKPANKWGGEFVKTKENKQAWLQMFLTSKASVQFQSPLVVDTLKKTIVINEWPSGLNPEKFLAWVRALEETQEAYPSKGSHEITIVMKKAYNSVQFDSYLKKIQNKTRVKSSYNINVTSRKAIITDGVVDYEVALLSLSVPKLVIAWLRARLEIEVKSLNYRIRKQQAAIAYSELLIFSASKLDIIIPIIRFSKTPKQDLAKKLKLSEEQADQILELKLRQLTKLDQDDLKAKLKEQQGVLSQLNKWLKNPKKKMIVDIDEAMQSIEADRKLALKAETQELELL